MLKAKLQSRGVLDWLVEAGIFVFLVLLLVKCLSVVTTSAFSFDGARIAQLAHNLGRNFSHSVSYPASSLNQFIELSTGLPFVLPLAIAFRLFGETFATGLAVNAAFVLLFALAVAYYIKFCLRLPYYFVLLSIIVFFGTPSIFDLGFGLYGELPMLFYFILFIIFLHKGEESSRPVRYLLAGLSLGLAYLTKTVMLIAIPALAFTLVFDILIKRRLLQTNVGIKRYIVRDGALLLGLVTPPALFEALRLAWVGPTGYIQFWQKYLKAVGMQAGVSKGFQDTSGGILAKLMTHLQIYLGFTERPVLILSLVGVLLFFAAVLISAVIKYFKKTTVQDSERCFLSNSLIVLTGTVLSYFGWWLLLTPTQKAWERRIIDGTILLEICFVVLVYWIWRWLRRFAEHAGERAQRVTNMAMHALAVLLVLGISLGYVPQQSYSMTFKNRPQKAAALAAATFIQSLPARAQFFGFGWWQAPVISFAAGRNFDDILENEEMADAGHKNEKYLVIDQFAKTLSQNQGKSILSNYHNRLVYAKDGIAIYKLISRYPPTYPDFTTQEKATVHTSAIDFSEPSPDLAVRNVYLTSDTGGGRWVQKLSGYLLKYDGQHTLEMYLWFPRLQKYDHPSPSIEIYINKNRASTYQVTSSGLQHIVLPLDGITESTVEVTLLSNGSYVTTGDARDLAFVIQRIILK